MRFSEKYSLSETRCNQDSSYSQMTGLPHMCSLSKPWWHYFSIYWWTTGIYRWSGLALCKFARAIIRGEEIMSVITDWKQQQKSIFPQFSRPEVPGIYVVTLPEPVSFGGRWQTSPDVLAHIFFPLHVSFSFIFVKNHTRIYFEI